MPQKNRFLRGFRVFLIRFRVEAFPCHRNEHPESHLSQTIFKLRALTEEHIHPSTTLPVRITANKNESIHFYSTPLSDQDMTEAGGHIEPEEKLESRIEQLILDCKTPGRHWNQCSVHDCQGFSA